jgi:hypothetical protein
MKGDTSYKNKLLRISCLYSALFLGFTTLSVYLITSKNSPQTEVIIKETVKKEYVYSEPDNEDISVEVFADEQPIYTVKEYMGKIGIFLADGSLYDVIEVYVKTLPTADRRLLEEGFEVVGNTRLYSIIEDYSV